MLLFKFLKNVFTSFVVALVVCCNNNVFADIYIVDVVVIGNYEVGKSSLIERFVKDSHSEKYVRTNGVEIWEISHNIDHDTFAFRFWDAPGYVGGEANQKVIELLSESGAIKNAKIAIIVTNLNSDIGVVEGIKPIGDVMGYTREVLKDNITCKIFVVGTHKDEIRDSEKVQLFKSELKRMWSGFCEGECLCYAVSTVEHKDPEVEDLNGCLLKAAKVMAEEGRFEGNKHCSGKRVKCCVCHNSLYEEECTKGPIDNEWYCPTHIRDALFRRKCPGPNKPGYYYEDDPKTYFEYIEDDGKTTKYCSKACMYAAHKDECEFCHNPIDFAHRDDYVWKPDGTRYCTIEHLREARGTPCPNCRIRKLLPGEGKKVENSDSEVKVCGECQVFYCGWSECNLPLIGRYASGKNGKKYCNRDHYREDAGSLCPVCRDRKILDGDKGVVKTQQTSYCSRECAIKGGNGVQCSAGILCTHYDKNSGARKYLPGIDDIVPGQKDANKAYCDEQCRVAVEGENCNCRTCKFHTQKRSVVGMIRGDLDETRDKYYCDRQCKLKEEGQVCAYDGCSNHVQGIRCCVGEMTLGKNQDKQGHRKLYCNDKCRDEAEKGGCIIM